ncbi:MAG: peptide-methionine (R)-S-oxide reductase MsrB [Gammaproteobacteria bacterium]|nr:peptide-methionine (R)-S-oxide reductase MsrB [Gammaproteobacteria bacterium]MCP4982248.1 peptide-methionine (R)-S-oxide reductase MsrB [Gammaproteobacteria bacterium]
MNRRLFLAYGVASAVAIAASRSVFASSDSSSVKGDFPSIDKTREEWQKLLDKQQYKVLFEEATERPWSSSLNDEKREGTYICSACYLPLFLSQTKFDSGTGWPSFYQAIEGNAGTRRDWKLIIPRTEYHCARCGGHQGHIFGDGPKPTGKRWCNNGVALRFIPASESLPELRT